MGRRRVGSALGDGTPADDSLTRRSITGIDARTLAWERISTGGSVSVGLISGQLWTWGSSSYGELGDGTTTARPVAAPMGSDSWTTAVAGENHVLAIRSDGTLGQWGLIVRGAADGTGRV